MYRRRIHTKNFLARLFFLSIIICSSSVFGQNELKINLDVHDQIVEYIDSINSLTGPRNFQFVVFYLQINNNSNSNEICFDISHKMNSHDLKHIEFSNYFLRIKNKYVLLNLKKDSLIHVLNEFDVQILHYDTLIKIAQNLYPSDVGAWTYDPLKLIFCSLNGHVFNREYYRNEVKGVLREGFLLKEE